MEKGMEEAVARLTGQLIRRATDSRAVISIDEATAILQTLAMARIAASMENARKKQTDDPEETPR
jgi:hypothetical protein